MIVGPVPTWTYGRTITRCFRFVPVTVNGRLWWFMWTP
jgi:hypothetical protein